MSNSAGSEQCREAGAANDAYGQPSPVPVDGVHALANAIEKLTAGLLELGSRMGLPTTARAEPVVPIAIGNLELNARNHQVSIAGDEIDLSAGEFRLMHQLVSEFPDVVSFKALNAAYHGHPPNADRNLRVYMRRLRLKLNNAPSAWTGRILSVRSVGYRVAGP